jgi:hypothetical protein
MLLLYSAQVFVKRRKIIIFLYECKYRSELRNNTQGTLGLEWVQSPFCCSYRFLIATSFVIKEPRPRH